MQTTRTRGCEWWNEKFEEYEKHEKSRDEVEKERESYARKHSKSLLKKITAKLMKYIKER